MSQTQTYIFIIISLYSYISFGEAGKRRESKYVLIDVVILTLLINIFVSFQKLVFWEVLCFLAYFPLVQNINSGSRPRNRDKVIAYPNVETLTYKLGCGWSRPQYSQYTHSFPCLLSWVGVVQPLFHEYVWIKEGIPISHSAPTTSTT